MLIVLLGILLSFLRSPYIVADEAPSGARFTKLSIGFSGTGRVGSWLPIRAEATGLPPRNHVVLAIECSDARGDQCESIVAETVVSDGGTASFAGVFMAGRQDDRIAVRVVDDQSAVVLEQIIEATSDPGSAAEPSINDAAQASSTEASTIEPAPVLDVQLHLHRHAPLGLLTVGSPAGIGELVASNSGTGDVPGAVIGLRVESNTDLPSSRQGWDAVDVFVFQDDFDLTAAQTAAMQQWLVSGGHLIVSAGRNQSQLLAAPVGSWIQKLFGIGAGENDPPATQDLSALQNFVSGATTLQTNRQSVPFLRMTSDQPRMLVTSLSGPLLARRSIGAGIVTLVPVELNSRPLNNWRSLPDFYEQLIFGTQIDNVAQQEARTGRISSSGMSDISTQLAAATDAIPPESRWSSWQAMLLVLVYVVVIGPLDYFLVTRVFRRPTLTWLTFPLLVTTACGLMVLSGANSGGEMTVRQVHLLDVVEDSESDSGQFMRSRSWSSLSSRESRVATIGAKSATMSGSAVIDASFNWSGRAENVFGGLYRPGGSGLGRQSSRRTNLGASWFMSLPMIADGSLAFVDDRMSSAPARAVFESDLFLTSGGLLDGSFQHHLPAAIEDWMIVLGNRAYVPMESGEGAIEPGTVWSRSSRGVRVTDLKDVLRSVRSIEFDDPDRQSNKRATAFVQSEYDPQNRDAFSILMYTSLFELAGGETWVRLSNDFLRRDDCSRSVQLNVALLIGTLKEPLTNLQVDEQPVAPAESRTIVRLFLPVMRKPRASVEPLTVP